MQFELGRYRMKAPMVLFLLVVGIAPVLVQLGRWQWDRGLEKEAMLFAFEQAQNEPTTVSEVQQLAQLETYSKIRLSGTFDAERQLLQDNQTHNGRVGFNVLTPAKIGEYTVLINRGWVPADRRKPAVDIGLKTLEFENVEFFVSRPSVGILLGDPTEDQSGTQWPRIIQAPDMQSIQALYQTELSTEILQVVGTQSWSFESIWKPIGGSASKHFAYAMQWFGFAIALVGMTLFASIKTKKND